MLDYTIYRNNKTTTWVTFVHWAGGSASIWYKQVRDFRKHFNVLLLDLRDKGHTQSEMQNNFSSSYSLNTMPDAIIEVLNNENIANSHFIGISLGTILIRNIAEKYPSKVTSIIMGGAVTRLNWRIHLLMRLGVALNAILPYLWMCKLFSFIIMPSDNLKELGSSVKSESRRLSQNDLIKWFGLTFEINHVIRFFRKQELKIPTLYIMGGDDYLFLPAVKRVIKSHKNALFFTIEDCGHIVNIEQPKLFNAMVIGYLKGVS